MATKFGTRMFSQSPGEKPGRPGVRCSLTFPRPGGLSKKGIHSIGPQRAKVLRVPLWPVRREEGMDTPWEAGLEDMAGDWRERPETDSEQAADVKDVVFFRTALALTEWGGSQLVYPHC